ncbi:MAG: hypothetical protein LIP03_15020 [Bacteroidales bacterium]|nr:hypothetical protein [Bacteroidales bacterium]
MKTKIVLDADVIIHFIKGERLSQLCDIFPEYEYILLDVVYNELKKRPATQAIISNWLNWYKSKITLIRFAPSAECAKEFLRLRALRGDGESACLAYCRYNQDVIGSSNLKDILDYCIENNITYLTTLDFLYYAYIRKVFTREECNQFISTVKSKGSKIGKIDDIVTYQPNTII